MSKRRNWLRKAFTSVTIMVIPHDSSRTLNLKLPALGFLAIVLCAAIGGGCVVGLGVKLFEYKERQRALAEKVNFYSEEFHKWNGTMTALKVAEDRFRKLFSVRSKEEVLQRAEASVGSIEFSDLAVDLRRTIGTVAEIRDYLQAQRDIYVATPTGLPTEGRISSDYGRRLDPMSGRSAFHSGIDVSANRGTPILATADGVVSHSGWTPKGGFVVVLEHGCGFSTAYAHNQRNTVKVGAKVNRGDIIGYVGSTGKSTGPHVHYEVWKDGRTLDPRPYFARRS